MEKQIIIYKIGNQEFGIEIENVHEIVKLQKIIKIHSKRKDYVGIINLRNKIIPIFDLRKLFLSNDEIKNTPDSRIIIIDKNSEQSFGFLVDTVREVKRIDETFFEEIDKTLKMDDDLISVVAKIDGTLLPIVDLRKYKEV